MASCTCADPQMVANAIKTQDKDIVAKLEEIHQTLYGETATVDKHSSGESAVLEEGSSDGWTTEGSGSSGLIAPIRFSNWASPEVSGDSDKTWNNLLAAAQIAIAISNAAIQGSISDKAQDLANAYYSMAKYKWDRFEQNYMPLEKKLLEEVSSVDPYEMDCTADRDRAVNKAVNPSYSIMATFVKQKAAKYRICIDPSMSSMLDFRRAKASVDTENYNLLDDRWFTDYKNDQRWNRRSQMLNLGRNLTSLALSYGEVSRSLLNKVGAEVSEAASSLMSSIGYFGGRNDTYYPTTFLGSMGGMSTALTSTTMNPIAIGEGGLS